MNFDIEKILSTIENDIIPKTRAGVLKGNKIFGGAILKGFSFAMILGVIVGTYSSIYIANPILVRLNVSQKTILKEEKE